MLGHSQKTIPKIFTTQITSVNEDPLASRLQDRITEMTNELQESYKSHVNEVTHQNQDTAISRIVYKSELNKCIAENLEKEKMLASLQSEIESLYGEHCDGFDHIEYNKKETADPVQDRLEKNMEKILNEVDYVEKEQSCIKGMLRKEKESILVLKERLQELNEAHRKITKSYSMALYSSKKAWNNLTLVNNQIAILKKDMRQRKKDFLTSYDKQNKMKTAREKDINMIIKSISQKSLNSNDKKKLQVEVKSMLKEQSRVFDENQSIKQSFLKNLTVYEEKFQIINKVVQGLGLKKMEKSKKMKKLDENGVNLIIQAYTQLNLQESSLSSRFEHLSSECLEKKQEHEKYFNKLEKLKEENKEIMESNVNPTTTYNMLKEQIENNVKIMSQSEKSIKVEETVLRVYLDVLNVATVSMKFLMEIKEQANVIDPTLQQYIRSANAHLDTLKRGFFYKREIIGFKASQTKKQGQKPLDSGDVSLEYYNKQIYPYFSLTKLEITSAYEKRFSCEEDAERLARFIKKKPIIYSFITPELLSSYLLECETDSQVYENIYKLLRLGHSEYQAQYLKLVTLTLDIALKVRNQTKSEISQIQKFYPDYNPNDPNFFDMLMKMPKRRPFKMPTVIKDKIKNALFLDEEARGDAQMLKTYDITTKGIKKEKKFEDKNSECSEFKQGKIPILENPQAVLKEVLSIEEKIKRIKSKERKAELKDTIHEVDSVKLLKQPWTPRIKRAKTQEKGIRRKISLEMLTPKLRPFNIKL